MKTIKLNNYGTGRYDDVSPFIIANNALRLKVDLPQLSGEFYLVAENNGVKIKKPLQSDGEVTLEDLTAGVLNAEVKHYLKGELIKVYKVEPLLLKELDGSLSATPEIEELNRRISSIERDFSEYKLRAEEREIELKNEAEERKKALLEWQSNTSEILQALVRFAYEDFVNNVYLGGGSKEDFAARFGFDPQIINLLKGANDND